MSTAGESRVLSLYLSSLAIDRLQKRHTRHRAAGAHERERMPAMLLTAHDGGRQVVVQACARSRGMGVKLGMSLAHARALAPLDAVIELHDPERDRATLEALARWAVRFSPVVQVDPPDGLLLEITGCAHLFGGTRRMLEHIVGEARRLGLHAHAAIGPSVGSAWALARYGGASRIVESPDEIAEALAPLPVMALRIEPDVERSLRAVAVETVGELLRLPRGSLAERFGEPLLLRLDQALGQAFEPMDPLRPVEPVMVERVFAGPVKQLEAVLQTGRELVTALGMQLAQREAGARQVRMELDRIDAQNLHETLTLSRPSRNGKHLWSLLRPRLERVNMGFGIERMALRAVATGRLVHGQEGLVEERHGGTKARRQGGGEEERRGGHEREGYEGRGGAARFSPSCLRASVPPCLSELIDQLAAQLGRERVSVIETRATHVPERVFVHRPADERGMARRRIVSTDVIDADRPTLLYDRPRPVQVTLLAPDGPVMAMTTRNEHLRVVTSIGPERITPRWWLVADDKRRPSPRDYFKVQDDRGRWWWIYRREARRHGGTEARRGKEKARGHEGGSALPFVSSCLCASVPSSSHWFIHGRWC